MSIVSCLEIYINSLPRTWRDEVEVMECFSLKPVDTILDYYPAQKIRIGWCNEKGTNGSSRKAVIHAIAERPIQVKHSMREPGDYLCGFKSTSKWGQNDFNFLVQKVSCLKCVKAIAELQLNCSIRHD